jgi:predicted ABC-class ATPase
MHKMLLKLYPQISAQQQLLKVIALSRVRDVWIERALLPLWVSVRVMKTQASGKTSRRRSSTISDRGLLPALLQV